MGTSRRLPDSKLELAGARRSGWLALPTLGADTSVVLDGRVLGKPADREDYTYERHVAWMSQWLTGLDLTDLTLFCQDWGGLLGLRAGGG